MAVQGAGAVAFGLQLRAERGVGQEDDAAAAGVRAAVHRGEEEVRPQDAEDAHGDGGGARAADPAGRGQEGRDHRAAHAQPHQEVHGHQGLLRGHHDEQHRQHQAAEEPDRGLPEAFGF